MEGADLGEKTGKESVVVQKVQKVNGTAEHKTGHTREKRGGLVKGEIGIRHSLGNLFLHFAEGLLGGVVQLGHELHDGLANVQLHFTLDGQHDLHAVSRHNALTADKAVDAGNFGYRSDVGGNEKMHHAEALEALAAFFVDVILGGGNVKFVGKEIAGVVALFHDEGLEGVHRKNGFDASAFFFLFTLQFSFFLLNILLKLHVHYQSDIV